ncbi:MAG: histidine phosphatase family protein [Nocardioides sp.]
MGARLFLVRHGRSDVDVATPPETWGLHPDGLLDIEALGASGRIPDDAAWYSSPEPKALGTAHLLAHLCGSDTDESATGGTTAHECGCGAVMVVPELAEHRRAVRWFEDADEFRAAVRRAFEEPESPAVPEWEPLADLGDRLLPAVRRILDSHPGTDVVLAGHGTAWTLLVSELTGAPPDLDAWAALRMPDVWMVDRGEHAGAAE